MHASKTSVRMGPPYHSMMAIGKPVFRNQLQPPSPRILGQSQPWAHRQKLFSSGPVDRPPVIRIDESSSSSSSPVSSDGEDEIDNNSNSNNYIAPTIVEQQVSSSTSAQVMSSPIISQPKPPVIVRSVHHLKSEVVPSQLLCKMKPENKYDSKGTMGAGNSRVYAPIVIPSDDSDTDDVADPVKPSKRARISTSTIPSKPKSTPDQLRLINILPRNEEDGELNEFIQYGMSLIDADGILKKLSALPCIERPKRINQKGLYSQVKHGNLVKAIAFLKAGANPTSSIKSEDGRTAMHIAASKGHLDILLFLSYKAGPRNIDCHDASGRTPLFAAVEKKHMDIAQLLVKGGANPKLKTREGMNLLHAAARKGSLVLVKWLVKLGLPINDQDNFGWTALMWAAESDTNAEIMEYLIKVGALSNLVDKELNICLHWSAIAGSFECTKLLVIGSADPLINAKNKFGETPLHVAAKGNHFHVTQFLLLNGADHLIKNKNNSAALDVCLAGSKTFHSIRIRHELEVAKVPIYTHLTDISCGKERVPVSCVNEVDNEKYPNDFVYIANPIESNCVMVKGGLTTVRPCKCSGACRTGCKCITLSEQQKLWYLDDGRLDISIFEEESPVLYECTPLCTCWDYCPNRVVQKGIQYPLQVFKTHGKGWGLRTLTAIPTGSFVLSYVGELITDEEAEKRNKDTYLFNLDLKTCGDEPNCMDALKYGNCGRFINHCCDANMRAVKLFTSHRDISFPGVAFFACKDIETKEELSFHYGDSFWDVKNKNGMYCKCSSLDCQYNE